MKLRPTQIQIHSELRPFSIPQGFVLVQDTREQKPLFAYPPDGLEVVTATLGCGDYSIRGFEDRFSVERKQISDFYGYIGKERDRTTRKMGEFRQMICSGGWVGLAIESTEADLLAGYVMSRIAPEMVRQALVSFEVRYGVHTYYSRSRSDITRWVLDRAIKFYRIQREAGSSNAVKRA